MCTLTGVVGWNFPRLHPAVQRIYLVLSKFEEAFKSVQKAGKQLLPKQTTFFRELTEAKLYQRELLIRVKWLFIVVDFCTELRGDGVQEKRKLVSCPVRKQTSNIEDRDGAGPQFARNVKAFNQLIEWAFCQRDAVLQDASYLIKNVHTGVKLMPLAFNIRAEVVKEITLLMDDALGFI